MDNPVYIRQATIADAEAITRVHVQAWRETYQGIVEQEYLDDLDKDPLRLEGRRNVLAANYSGVLLLVAECRGEIIGFCDAGPYRGDTNDCLGEVYTVYLLSSYTNQGIGLRLMQTAIAHLIKENLAPYMVWVLEENKIACRFYEKLGGVVFQDRIIEIGSRQHKELACRIDLYVS